MHLRSSELSLGIKPFHSKMDNGKENGNYCSVIGYILGLYRDNGKENGNYYGIISGLVRGPSMRLLRTGQGDSSDPV